jgi:hypothetical protein
LLVTRGCGFGFPTLPYTNGIFYQLQGDFDELVALLLLYKVQNRRFCNFLENAPFFVILLKNIQNKLI